MLWSLLGRGCREIVSLDNGQLTPVGKTAFSSMEQQKQNTIHKSCDKSLPLLYQGGGGKCFGKTKKISPAPALFGNIATLYRKCSVVYIVAAILKFAVPTLHYMETTCGLSPPTIWMGFVSKATMFSTMWLQYAVEKGFRKI